MDRANKIFEMLTNLGQLALTLILLRVAWAMMQLMTWTGAAQ